MKRSLLALAMLGNAVVALAQSAKPEFVTKVENISEYRLPSNGLKILLIPDATVNNVLVNIVYNVGSRHEGYGETGMAHLLEHMLFKGTQRLTDIKKIIADKGAMANGTTWYDRTNYYEILPASDENLKWALDMEADRMVNSRISQEDLSKEFSVVRNEFESGENDPGGILQERILSTMYLWHNYGKSTIGSKEDIEKVPAESLRAFYKKYYQPDNATLVIAGKFDNAKTLEWIGQYFSAIPKPARVLVPDYTVEPAQDGERFVELKRNGDIQYIGMGYHTPAFASEDYVANDALIEILTNEPSGVLYKALIETKKATKVYGYAMPLYHPGFTYFNCEVPNDKSLADARAAMTAEMDKIGSMTITEEQLTRAKNSLKKAVEDQSNNTIGFAVGLTEIIGGGNYRLWFIYRDRLEKLSLKDVQDVAKRYYKASNRTVGIFTPDKNPDRAIVANTPDINALTANYKGKEVKEQTETFEVSIANIKAKTVYGSLSNGMKYALLKKPTKNDKIQGTFMFKMGDEQSLSGKDNIAYLTSRMLKYGTKTRSRQQIADELDKIKTSINFYGGATTLYASISTDKEHLAAAMAMLEDMLLNPVFDVKEFDKLQLDAKADLEAYISDPGNVASETLTSKLNHYPKNHPLYSPTSAERLEDIKKVTVADIKSFYNDFYGANNGYVSFVGAIDANEMKAYFDKSLGKWNSKKPYKEIAEKYFDNKGTIETVQIDDKANATLMGGININLTQKDPDFLPLMMANEMLGGGAFLSSRIPNRLREAEGMSYGAGSYYQADYKYPSGAIGVYAIFNPQFKDKLNTALDEEIKKAIANGFTEDEWKSSLQSWLTTRKASLDNNGAIINMLNSYMYDGKDLTYYSDMETKAKALKLADINAALKKYFDTGKLILIYAGDFNKKG
ncbi:MAG: insulinase family protein, partial [Flavipsychrobacter sp.]|nr:insulinase family protein [Flavipsychrobacter sp.]